MYVSRVDKTIFLRSEGTGPDGEVATLSLIEATDTKTLFVIPPHRMVVPVERSISLDDLREGLDVDYQVQEVDVETKVEVAQPPQFVVRTNRLDGHGGWYLFNADKFLDKVFALERAGKSFASLDEAALTDWGYEGRES